MTTFVSLDSNLDLNSLFKMTFDYNLFKEVIDVMITNQKTLTNKVTNLENNSITKDKQLAE